MMEHSHGSDYVFETLCSVDISMAFSASHFSFKHITFLQILPIILTIPTQHTIGCYTSIISFGDSLADTGNYLHYTQYSHSTPPNFAFPPYGETYFHRPTGRCSDGRLIIDFIAQYLGLQLVPPYLGDGEKNVITRSEENFEEGVNFAVVGASALDAAFYKEIGLDDPCGNFSLEVQLGWFKEMLPSLCTNTSSDCNKLLQSSLVLLGTIGGNDYDNAFMAGLSFEEVQSFVPLIVNVIASAINELIKLGAVTLMVPGIIPIGCLPVNLAYYNNSKEEEYDPLTGCLIWLNKFAEYHNELLQIELNQIRELHPHTTIIYADYYNDAMRFYLSPSKFGFTEGALTACCGGGGPYNVNSTAECGSPESTSCDNPSLYASWDGLHFTEAAYKWISQGLLFGPYTIPPLNTSCVLLV
ncbi:GDSL esterase/lipase At1g28570-like isoform X2 [Cornus florida]|uniref:GDSL esterase/lipase At1g28570-like isoform X2 n=1 Tax=Cornus florida TaxID=4283 RepID=UPI00289CBD98|nr:GDSL esterase/lipase At1g28570-like isoform X2 [Cornus florida]